MAALYIGIILLFRVVQAVFSKRSSNEVRGIPMVIGYSAYRMLLSALMAIPLLLIVGNGFRMPGLTLPIAAFSGVMLFCSSMCSIFAMKTGSVSLCSLFATAGLLIPCFAGIFLFDQPIHPMQWVGIGIFFVSAVLLIGSSRKICAGFGKKTVFLLLGSLLSNGCTMLAQQMFTRYVPDGDVSMFSFLSFGTIGLLCTVVFAFLCLRRREGGIPTDWKLNKVLLLCGFALAVAVFVINQLATLSTALVSPVVLFTFINGGDMMISTLVAALLYRERLTPQSVAGVLCGAVSLIIVQAF